MLFTRLANFAGVPSFPFSAVMGLVLMHLQSVME